MGRTGNFVRIFLHFNWTTKYRTAIIDEAAERIIRDTASKKALEFGCHLLAINGTNDHIHLLVGVPATIQPADLVKHVKGVSAYHINKMREASSVPQVRFQWQSGYAAFSVSPGAVKSIRTYIDLQKEHHATGALRAEFEVSGEEEVGED